MHQLERSVKNLLSRSSSSAALRTRLRTLTGGGAVAGSCSQRPSHAGTAGPGAPALPASAPLDGGRGTARAALFEGREVTRLWANKKQYILTHCAAFGVPGDG